MPAEEPFRLLVDVSRWPLVILTYQGRPTNEALEAHLAEIEQTVLARRERFAQVIDQRGGARPDPMQRAIIASHQGRMADAYSRQCAGEAYVASQELRGAMTAVFWREPPRYPVKFFDTLEEAVAWALERLAAPGP
ncbi:MAG TPA: hypothetical protein VLS93_16770 [Anaeromyxobacteraceae bacterium]|nr:hypothetical protein [Anaeromyxobacteraceae bacterium]